MEDPSGTAGGGMAAGEECHEQVLVAAFPGSAPEVHMASLDSRARVVNLREASVTASGEVSLGQVRAVALADVKSLERSSGSLALVGCDGVLVQLHFESVEDLRTWVGALRPLLIGKQQSGKQQAKEEEKEDEEVALLRARSEQLQDLIAALDTLGQRRDHQLQKLSTRLDGATQMLAAVQDMCSQQRKVLAAQKVAITELKEECGEPMDDAEEVGAQAEEEPGNGSRGGTQREGEEAEEEIDGKLDEMMDLLRQVQEMHAQLQTLQSTVDADGGGADETAAPSGASSEDEASLSPGA